MPGMNQVLNKMREAVTHIENVDNDLSTSNLAILSLPLLMAIPPISLLQDVSGKLTAWYAFATDFLAALPLLIKGVELIIAYDEAQPKLYATLSTMGKHYGFLESWLISCRPGAGRFGWLGNLLLCVSSWFILASTYFELIFWRLAQYKKGRLKKIRDRMEEDGIVEKSMDSRVKDTFEIAGPPGQESLRSRPKSRRCIGIVVLVLSVVIFFLVMSSFEMSVSLRRLHSVYITCSILLCISLVLLRAVTSHRMCQFAQQRFLLGLVFGFCTGPLYLILHGLKRVRGSQNWAEVSQGASTGFASLGMVLHFLIHATVFHDMKPKVIDILVFIVLFIISNTIVHMIRDSAEEKSLWRYAIHGFILGVLFGPFGSLFKTCFPELSENNEQIRYNFFGSIVAGTIFICTLTLNLLLRFVPDVRIGL